MSRTTTSFAIVASVLLVASVAAPVLASDGSLSVGVSQADTGSVTVSVTHNGSAAGGASVSVQTVDDNASYDGTGSYTADDNGTVSLPAPNETVNVSVTASYDNGTASTKATLSAVDSGGNQSETNESETNESGAFGDRVSTFVHELQSSSSNNTSDAPLGAMVASYVVANNPGNAPDHAGPPEWLTNDSVNRSHGPPDHAGPPENKSGGPPDDKGGPPDDKGNNGGGPPDDKGGGGPPDHAGSSDD